MQDEETVGAFSPPPPFPMHLSIIVAVAENGVIGREGALPWHLSADLERFKRLTMGRAIVMGRKTWESIRRPLPGRTSVVISRRADFELGYPEVLVATDLEKALAHQSVRSADEAFVIGGATVYQLALPVADRLYLTRVHAEVDGDTYFPEVDWHAWQLIEEETHEPDPRNEHPYSFQVYERASQ